jgi:aminopeptidase N
MKVSHRLHSRCACAAAPFALAGTEPKYERSRPFVTTHLALDLTLDFDEKSVAGTARLLFERRGPLDHEFVLDAVGFELQGVRLRTDQHAEPEAAVFSYDGDQIRISIPEQASNGEVEVSYRAAPRLGLYFLAPDRHVKNRPRQVWSQCQDEDARHWFPCQDKPHVKMTTELRVTVPHGMTALSNGELVSSDTPEKGKSAWVFHYAMRKPHPAYLVTLVVGEFAEIADEAALPSGRVIPVRYLVPPQLVEQGQRSFGATPRMIELFSRLTGVEYPWDRYSQVVVSDFIFGGMENTTATTMYEHVLLDARAALDVESNDLVAHELAHQWFGDLVTCRDWSHAWLNEGFATFFEHLERESRLGRDEYEHGVAGDLETYLGEANGSYKRPIVCREYEEPIDLFDRHLYEKGGLVLHMLRRELGDGVFWAGVRRYLEAHLHGVVETLDFRRALEAESGRSLERFFDEWVLRPGHPELEVTIGYEAGVLSVEVEQKQKGDGVAVFHLPLEVEVEIDGVRQRHRRELRGRKDVLSVRLEKRPTWVGFDPDFRITAPVKLKAPSDLLQRQLRQASTARLRRVAAEALADRQDLPTIQALRAALSNTEEVWMVRAEAAEALGRIGGDDALAALGAAATEPHPKVRRAVATALGQFRRSEAAKSLQGLALKDESYLVRAAAARALGKTGDKRAFEVLSELLDADSWAEVIRAGALEGFARLGDERAIEAVIERTQYGHPMRARRAALAALPKLAEGRRVREHLITLLDDKDPHVRASVVAALEELGDPKATGALRELESRELEGRVIRRVRTALASLGGDRKRDLRALRDETEKLRGELRDLKTRLSKLEQAGEKSTESSENSQQKGRVASDTRASSDGGRTAKPRSQPTEKAGPKKGKKDAKKKASKKPSRPAKKKGR